MPNLFIDIWKYQTKSIDKTKLKETFYRFLKVFKSGEIDLYVKEFWDTIGLNNIYSWYYEKKKSDDVIISASPRWLLTYPICIKLGVRNLICSEMDKKNGDYYGLNCYGEEKVNRFYKEYPNGIIDEFYSDSYSDKPLAKIAKKSFLVKKGGIIVPWSIK